MKYYIPRLGDIVRDKGSNRIGKVIRVYKDSAVISIPNYPDELFRSDRLELASDQKK